ncbi:DUF309 domain-containing protein [Picrophilus oshimae]|uniref:DUF309 domain-containing protein n=1 Tax=Picrophilus torridus (strain ATCC 700027 / DSM 9790 / JCM 10055 / NBRC 100828 / KAW 2/3) TaxID=1122961 RepID=Q6KYX1_PICTO|nr:DUF309 domain-containing protein [Picrophilus oshimae]AAT44081.1 conserved hypothetical protein [Picrophilus oshimae DSM 9789]SMD30850.1 hypothetical protein SAMN02745355_0764 [Picrophilus oshimae DSM 9789]
MRYIYFFGRKINLSERDKIFRDITSKYKCIHDLRCAFDHTEISSFENIDFNIIDDYLFYIELNEKSYTFNDGISLMVQERFWEAHEALEQLWRHSNGLEKSTLRFIIMVCTAFVHLQRGHYSIYHEVMENALKIDTYNEYKCINIKSLKSEIRSGIFNTYFFIKSLK